MTAKEVWISRPGQVEVRKTSTTEPGDGEVRIQAAVSAISSGTELLGFRGQLPESERDFQIDPHTGSGEYPMRTGYCFVGRVDAIGDGVDNHWLGRRVFAFRPHGTSAITPIEYVIPIPEAVGNELATFIPNLETALGIVMDANPVIGERVVVLGQGIVGLLVTRLLSRFPLELLAVIERLPERRSRAVSFGADLAIDSRSEYERAKLERRLGSGNDYGADLVLELTGNPSALNEAFALAGYGGRIIAGSWYGSKTAELDLGGRFHRNRISLVCSQVSTISPHFSGRWTKDRRMREVLRLLPQLDLESLITHRFGLGKTSDAFALVDQHPDQALQVLLTCQGATNEVGSK